MTKPRIKGEKNFECEQSIKVIKRWWEISNNAGDL